ncbi:hypothetical protein C7974DRAFT_29442 [Boeremia exigua]|uniref:uncharacterized protein n=1 Tax=Boeremia exigua TaxID=749465 RepID=UPI001E8CA18F|nr:uncharacterized protein C7974DRAFT_29442 [Boeremia exigua]KAH6644874.1 hypothetical protein C7974DRAFT_29442 [Boeremia exigua]
MTKSPVPANSMETALLASHALIAAPTKLRERPQTPPPTCDSFSSCATEISPRAPVTPTSRRPLTPTTPCAPRKWSFFEPSTPQKRTRRTPSTADSSPGTPSRPRRNRRKTVMPLDKTICIPMCILRAQKDDTSALLRPAPRPSDQVRRLVDLSVGKTIEKLRAPGATGILDAAVQTPWSQRGGATTGSPTKPARRVKKT